MSFSKLAIAGLVCALVGCFVFLGTGIVLILGVLALIFGYAGWYEIKGSDGRLGAAWVAYVAWFLGFLAIVSPFYVASM